MTTKNIKQHQWMGWFICGLGAIFYSYEYLLRILPSVMEGALKDHFQITATGFGCLSAAYYYAYVPMQLPVGIFMDRFGPKKLLTLACSICVLGTFLFAYTNNYNLALIARFLVGFGSAFAFVGVLKLATIWLPENKLGMVSGIATALGTVGAMLGDNLLGAMVYSTGWQKTVYISAIFGLILTLVLWYGICDRNNTEKKFKTHELKLYLLDFVIILKNKQIWLNGFYGCLVYLPTTVFAELWGIPYLQHAHNLSQAQANFCNSILFLGFTIGAPTMGFISDKLKNRKMPMFVGAMIASAIMSTILFIPNLGLQSLDILMFLLGLSYSVQSIVFAVGRELSPNEAAGTAIAITNMIVMIGAMFLQPLVGRLLDLSLTHRISAPVFQSLAVDKIQNLYTIQDYQFALSIIPIGIIIAALGTFFLRETHAHTK